jgi:zinc transport system substrate-binding protein
LARIDALDAKLRPMLAPYRGRAFYVFHPGFGYFADAYGLKEEVVEVAGQEPTAKHLHELSLHAKADGVKTLFIQPQYDPKNMQAFADAVGGRAVAIDGLGRDVLADLDDIARKIRAAMEESKPQP